MSGAPVRIAGYAALFDRPDAMRDRLRPGAFAATLAARRDKLPLFWEHRPERRIGWVERCAEDARGLRVVAVLDDPASRPARMVATGALDGLSFGYRARVSHPTPQGRVLEAVELFEISLVAQPMQAGARVCFVGAMGSFDAQNQAA